MRKRLITEPRGYPCQNVDYVLPISPARPPDGDGEAAAFGFVIGEQNKIYPLMSARVDGADGAGGEGGGMMRQA